MRSLLRAARNECTCVPSCIKPPAVDQGCPSDWYLVSHGCRPAYRHARAGLWCLLRRSCSRGACGRPGGGQKSSGGARSGRGWWPPRRRDRLKPDAIDIRGNIDPVHWFLSPAKDTRSSLYHPPIYPQFSRGPKNENSRTDVKKPDGRHSLKNASLVLLTRGEAGDRDRLPAGGQTRQDAEPGVLRRGEPGAHRPSRAAGLITNHALRCRTAPSSTRESGCGKGLPSASNVSTHSSTISQSSMKTFVASSPWHPP